MELDLKVDDGRRVHNAILIVNERDVVDRDAVVLGPTVATMKMAADNEFRPYSVDRS